MLKRCQQFKLRLLLKTLSKLQMAPQQLPVSEEEEVVFLFAAKENVFWGLLSGLLIFCFDNLVLCSCSTTNHTAN